MNSYVSYYSFYVLVYLMYRFDLFFYFFFSFCCISLLYSRSELLSNVIRGYRVSMLLCISWIDYDILYFPTIKHGLLYLVSYNFVIPLLLCSLYNIFSMPSSINLSFRDWCFPSFYMIDVSKFIIIPL